MILLAALILGICAGMRTFTQLTAVAWAAWSGRLDLGDSWFAFMGSVWAVAVLSLLALGELVGDKLSITPSRLKAAPFAARIISGGFCGFCVGGLVGAITGAGGAAIGTLAFWWIRAKLAKQFGKDWPAALMEDAVALAGVAFACVVLL